MKPERLSRLHVGSIPTPVSNHNLEICQIMNKTIEQTVAETILEQPFEIKVGKKSYQVASASTATLILVSEAISQLPHIALDTEKVVEETLSVAKDCRVLGDIAAILILGSKNITEKKKVPQIKEKRYLCGLIRRPYTVEIETTVDKKAELARELLEEVSPRELNLIVSQILSRMQIADFFGLTTFLTELNLLHPRKVEN